MKSGVIFLLSSLLFATAALADSMHSTHAVVPDVNTNQVGDVHHESDIIAEPVEHDAEKGTEKKEFDILSILGHHLNDSVLYPLAVSLPGVAKPVDLSITKRVVMMWIAVLIMLLIFLPAARKISKNPTKKPSRFTGIVEVFVTFVRDDIGRGSMGSHSKNYEPYLLTIFFFILISNLLGLLPPFGELMQITAEATGMIHHEAVAAHVEHSTPLLTSLWPGITATGDVSVNLVLAASVFLVILGAGFANQGPLFIFYIVPKGVPFGVNILMWVIEWAGLVIKSGVLAIRLLANMTAGHVVILVLLGFVFQFNNLLVGFISVPASGMIYLLELLVAFLQAYIFTFLTALFIASAQHRH